MFKGNFLTLIFFLVVNGSVLSESCDVAWLLKNGTRPIDSKQLTDRPCEYLLEFSGAGARFTTAQLAARYGFNMEKHHVTTEDGYILELHRIPAPGKPGKPVVYLLHGLFESSRDFLINCDRRAIAVRLADEGFDVWLGNLRGNTYSVGHVNLTRDDPVYWNFSIDEMIAYDPSASIDYILNVTKQDKLSWAGYSMANGIMLGFLSLRPEYNSKINVGFAMGAAASLTNTKNPTIRTVARFARFIESYAERRNRGEIFSPTFVSILNRVLPMSCLPEVLLKRNGLCALGLRLSDGYDPNQVDPRVLATMFAGFLSPVSVRSVVQWFQWINSGNFAFYDYGPTKNQQKYKQATPPNYILDRVTAPLVHFWGLNDQFTVPLDVKNSQKYLPHAVQVQVNSTTWNHVDFLFGRDSDVYVFDHIVDVLHGCDNTL